MKGLSLIIPRMGSTILKGVYIALFYALTNFAGVAQDIYITPVGENVLILHPDLEGGLEAIRRVGGTMTAVLTGEGFVVIDALISAEAAGNARKIIEAHYPNTPIRFLINTHHHADHVNGNSEFTEACIIGHANLESHMASPPAVRIAEEAMIVLGGKTFEILCFGTAHTDNDIVVLAREDRLLVMGDLLCYRKCRILQSMSDPENWIRLLDSLIDRQADYDYVIPGHGGGVLSVDALVEQREYLRWIVDTVGQTLANGYSLEQLIERTDFSRYKDYLMYDSIDEDIQAYWNLKVASISKNVSIVQEGNRYYDQEPPGKEPKIFAPRFVSTEHVEFGITFSPEANEMCFTRRESREKGNRILGSTLENGSWSEIEPAPFAMDCRESEPNFAPDGHCLFFNSRRPLPTGVETKSAMNVWSVNRIGSVWGEPLLIDESIREIIPMFVTVATDGSLYTTGNVVRGVYKSNLIDVCYSIPERLPDAVNGRHWAGHPYIAPDESFLIFDANIDDKGTKNLFISFRKEDGGWTESQNLSRHLGFQEHSWCPFVSFDSKYIFFSARQDIYWVDAAVIETLQMNY